MSDKMNPQDDNLIAGHEYDGIRELDNPLPGWWLFTFLITIIFGFIYWIHFHIADGGPLLDEELAADMAALKQVQQKAVGSAPSATVTDLEELAKNPAVLAAGKDEYVAKCVACHGQSGEGGIGPNLTDNYWIHGTGTLADIGKVTREGILDKGMPAWDTLLTADQINAVVVYVASLKGTKPAGGKAPQGVEVKGP